MDPAVAWFQDEQDGPAKRTWLDIWDTISDMDNITAVNNNSNNLIENNTKLINNNKEFMLNDGTTIITNNTNERNYYNPSRRKGSTIDNKASTYNMNRYETRLVGKHGGCPWRPLNFRYGRGIFGYVYFF